GAFLSRDYPARRGDLLGLRVLLPVAHHLGGKSAPRDRLVSRALARCLGFRRLHARRRSFRPSLCGARLDAGQAKPWIGRSGVPAAPPRRSRPCLVAVAAALSDGEFLLASSHHRCRHWRRLAGLSRRLPDLVRPRSLRAAACGKAAPPWLTSIGRSY